MPHQHIRTHLEHATAAGTALLAFNVVLLETAEALVTAAEEAARPVILQISQNCVRYHGSLAPIGAATVELARQAGVPVSVHLDHADDTDLIREAVELGFDSVMYDGSALGDQMNSSMTAEIATACHAAGVSVEAELGEIGGKDGVHSPTARTDPRAARDFVASTGVDSLAVAVGSSHAMLTREAQLDFELITRLADAVPVPLVLHGSSGVRETDLKSAVAAGIRKINISTHLNKIFTQALRARLADQPALHDPRKYVLPGREAVTAEAARMLREIGPPAGLVPAAAAPSGSAWNHT